MEPSSLPFASIGSGRASPISRLDPGDADDAAFADTQMLIQSRQNTSAKRLVEPGPSEQQLEQLLSLAAAAPDHGLLTPWRFVLVPRDRRHQLAEVFALDLLDRDAGATLQQIEAAREKAHRAPLLLLAVARLGPREPDTRALERMVSMGAAVQNILLGAHAMGFGAGLTSGHAMTSPRLRELLALQAGDEAVCCINIGTVSQPKRAVRCRPAPREFFSVLGAP